MKIQQRDFYLGACLFSFLNHNLDTTPSLIEKTDETTQIVKMTTNTSNDFYIFMKYTKDCKSTNIIHKSWAFPLTEKDKNIIEKYHNLQCPVYLFFICCETELKNGEIAIYRYEDYLKIKNKSSITINIKKSSDHYFNLHVSKSRDKIIRSKRTNIAKKISNIEIKYSF
ncbi:MAG: hypothetical protein HFJ09_08385 [Lachnospiraceae bacterium]|nr:hypothetical protein [Lachnospiraceae bacterium]